MRVTSSLLLIALIVFGVLALAANAAYPVFKEREAKEKLAQSAKEILAPEMQRNFAVLATIEKNLQAREAPIEKFDVAAWETISKGGLLLGLDSAVVTKLLRVYSLEYKANDLSARLLATTIGVDSALIDAQNIRNMLLGILEKTLQELQSSLTDLGQI
jgi:hypothetical protein